MQSCHADTERLVGRADACTSSASSLAHGCMLIMAACGDDFEGMPHCSGARPGGGCWTCAPRMTPSCCGGPPSGVVSGFHHPPSLIAHPPHMKTTGTDNRPITCAAAAGPAGPVHPGRCHCAAGDPPFGSENQTKITPRGKTNNHMTFRLCSCWTSWTCAPWTLLWGWPFSFCFWFPSPPSLI